MNTFVGIALIIIIAIVVILSALALSGYFTPSVDCEVSEWGPCDPVTGKRTRTIIKDRQGNGKICGVLEEDCPVNCVTSAWGPCVGGKQKRTILTSALNGGEECGSLEQSCFVPFSAGANLNTDPQDYKNLQWLDRHPKICSDKPINGFKVNSTTGGKVQFNYKCSDNLDAGEKTSKSTKALDTFKLSGLSRTPVECSAGEVLSNYGLANDNGHKFKYDCIKSNTELACRELSTTKSRYIADHNIQCDNDEVLGSFKVLDHGSDVINYVYSCCKKVIPKL
jgi:hypothetical protein